MRRSGNVSGGCYHAETRRSQGWNVKCSGCCSRDSRNMLQCRVMSELGNGRATIREIAELAGVSIATVSRVVNGREDVSPETRELVQRVVRERGYTANRSARGLSAGRTGLIGATVPMRPPRLLLLPPRRRRRGALRAGHAPRPLPDDARARPRGVAARAPHARDHRRRADHPPRGVERRARAAAEPRLPVRRHRSAAAAERAHPCRLRRARGRRRPGDEAPALARAHAHRGDHRPARLEGDRGPPARLLRGARGGGDHARPGARGRVELRDRRRRRWRPSSCSTCPSRRPRSSAFNDNMAIGAMQTARARGVRHPGGSLDRRLRRSRGSGDRDARR